MRGFNPFRPAAGMAGYPTKLLATGAAVSATAGAPRSPVHGGLRKITTDSVVGRGAGAHAFLPLSTPQRSIHRATHPLHLLRRHNAAAANISRICENIARGTGDFGETLPISLATPSAGGHGPNCPCCHPAATRGAATPRRSYATYSPSKPSGSSKEDIEMRNQLNAQRIRDRAAADAAESAEEAAAHKAADDTPVDRAVEREVAKFVGGRLVQSLQRAKPPRGSGIQPLLDYNKQWAGELARLNNNYFSDLAQQQHPQYLWVGCSDSRVPANEIVGLHPGEVFVHRNIANVVCNSDLNALAVLQYAIDCLKVEHVIISGHYRCGGVMAALNDSRIGLADHWILHVSAVKKRHWKRMMTDIPSSRHLDALCELNVLAQVESVVETHLVQRVWADQNAEDALARREGRPTRNKPQNEVEIHGWVYGLEDGIIRPLLSLTRRSNVERELANATEGVFWRFGQLS